VLRPDGSPAAGGGWVLERDRASAKLVELHGHPEETEDVLGVLGANGELEVAFDPHPAQRYTLTVDIEPWAKVVWNWRSFSADRREALGEVRLQATGRVSGRLLETATGDAAAPQWRVLLQAMTPQTQEGLARWSEYASVDEEGRFSLDRVPVGPIGLQAYHRQHGWRDGPHVNVAGGELSEVDFSIEVATSAATAISVECDRILKPFVPAATVDDIVLISASGERRSPIVDPDHPRFFRFDGVGSGEFRCEVNVPGARPYWKDGVTAGTALLTAGQRAYEAQRHRTRRQRGR
ncbi:MAG: hypothetical protein AAF368_13835, partial [Planctomycetota bacterium]